MDKKNTDGALVLDGIKTAQAALARALDCHPGEARGEFHLDHCKELVQAAQRSCTEAVRHLVAMQLRQAKDPEYQKRLANQNAEATTTLVKPHHRRRPAKAKEDPPASSPATVPASDTIEGDISS